MNKRELNEKWSKYCDTDKLVDDAMALLKSYGHRNSEQGVCALLDKYFTNKEPLLKMFATSKNYIGNMRIAIEKEFDRNISSTEVASFFVNAAYKFNLHEMFKYEDCDGKTLFDYLVTGKKVLSIDELPDESQQKKKKSEVGKFCYDDRTTIESHRDYEDFLGYIGYFSRLPYSSIVKDYRYSTVRNTPLLKKGTKTSRAFNKVCTHYGVDKFCPETVTVEENGKQVAKTVYPYNKLFAEYSDLVSNLTRKMQFIISLNPLDYLTMSHGVNWVSCHNIRSGGYMGGTLSYMLDAVSIITFVVEKIDRDDVHTIPKVYRQMYHYENNLFIQNRLYPQGNDGATNLYEKFRDFVIEEFTDLLSADSEWECEVGPDKCRNHAANADGSQHYPDHTYNRNASVFYPVNNKPSIRGHVMTIGHTGICVNCGKEYSAGGRLSHRYTYDCD